MSGAHAHTVPYVRETMLPEQDPPPSTVGAVGWMRDNLFSGWFNSLLTVLSLAFIFYILAGIIPWSVQSVWNADSLSECREIMQATWGETHGHACWGVIKDRWLQLLYGFYPPYPAYPDSNFGAAPEGHLWPAYFRPNLTLILLIDVMAAGPLVLHQVERSAMGSALLGILLTVLVLIGLLERRDKARFRMGYDSIAVLIVYCSGMGAILGGAFAD